MAAIETSPFMTSRSRQLAPTALAPGEGDAFWAFGFLATVKAPAETAGGQVVVIEHLGPRAAGSPRQILYRHDAWFYVLEGEVAFWLDGPAFLAPAGSFVHAPRGVPHTFIVASEQARFLLVTQPAGFDAFFRAMAVPAERRELPRASIELLDIAGLTALAASYEIKILGPPGIPA